MEKGFSHKKTESHKKQQIDVTDDSAEEVAPLSDSELFDYKHKFDLNDDYCFRKVNVVRIYDGDTVFVNINMGLNLTMNDISIRLFGINTPEVRGIERPDGLKSKDALISYINERKIILYTIKKKSNENDQHDKYGRLLGVLVDKETGENYNLKLLENGFAKPYFIN